MTQGMAHPTFWTFLMTCFMSPYDNISMRCTNMEIQMETASWENGSCITKTGRLGYVYAGAKTLLAKQV